MTTQSAGQGTLRLRLPATSANLGPGFDAAAIALDFALHIEARPAETFSIDATGCNADRCGQLEDNLILVLYNRLLAQNNRPAVPLAIRMHNEIPLGMGCGSSAAGRLAAILLANHFGQLGWNSDLILEEVTLFEGHPDNAAACWLGGFVTAACVGRAVHVARVEPPADWRAIVVLPPAPLATSKARAILPVSYSRADSVANVQSAALLGLAFAQSRADLLAIAMRDRLHQPYRESICPMLPRLLPLSGVGPILGVALSGAGPSVLAFVASENDVEAASAAIRAAVEGLPEPELRVSRLENRGASV
jgi:homoserine kinase